MLSDRVKGGLNVLVLLVVLAFILALSSWLFGCVSNPKVLSPDQVKVIAAAVVEEKKVGRDNIENEPWTARILAVGAGAAWLVYPLVWRPLARCARKKARAAEVEDKIALLVSEAVEHEEARHDGS